MTNHPNRSKRPFAVGERVKIAGRHPWAGEYGELLAYENYGPKDMFHGWRVRLSHGGECYANPGDLRRDA